MKTYSNGMKATETSRKQISVIYAKAKSGELKIERWLMNVLYDHADYYNFDNNGTVEYEERSFVKPLVEAVFNGKIDEAQAMIDGYTSKINENYSSKFVKNANRNLVA